MKRPYYLCAALLSVLALSSYAIQSTPLQQDLSAAPESFEETARRLVEDQLEAQLIAPDTLDEAGTAQYVEAGTEPYLRVLPEIEPNGLVSGVLFESWNGVELHKGAANFGSFRNGLLIGLHCAATGSIEPGIEELFRKAPAIRAWTTDEIRFEVVTLIDGHTSGQVLSGTFDHEDFSYRLEAKISADQDTKEAAKDLAERISALRSDLERLQ